MNVELSPRLRDTAVGLGAGVPYALKVLAGRLAEEPELGRPAGPPGILTVMVDGDLFEDCPTLRVHYLREPGRIEIRDATPTPSAAPARPPAHEADPAATDALTVREVTDAWQRVTRWLLRYASASHAALRPGADPATLSALERDLGTPIPPALRALWSLTAGDDGVGGAGCLPGNQALMTLDAVAASYRSRVESRAPEDTFRADRPEYDRFTAWQATWIPVISLRPADSTSGLYLDTATGHLGRWSRHNEPPADELDTLVTYLEEVADMLEAPALATRDRPGLTDGALVWSGEGRAWYPLTD
ncbi:SMI1/KNR4 family protein [Streptomyces liangshanensis]|uniref:Uncharacterized protein n=1 Tax=Streptomyces liangshanensis TaxID=2717324 RepID=A0A6G9H269_9ACTN|nr:SMI1/KNR4 family protein [Streptomyces liangshanensis]QIQ04416.1 hypothetical protein HA039_20800 [Streptomyces liangshanensis]